ncbi:MAG: pirin family protein [Planctomycetota bacterium]|jgi:redox-sensitive bicupin YhaK (pirin superfamily)
MNRDIKMTQHPLSTQDGAGVRLMRLFPTHELDSIDPFLLFDHFGSNNADDFIAGFPMHPHRGIETVTYMLDGRVRHKDSAGHSGTIEAGDVQWMSAGRGIMHEEMPERADGRLAGFQLWVNLPASEKMKPAEYQEYQAEEIIGFGHQGHTVRLVSGELLGHEGVVQNVSTAPIYADITLNAGRLDLHLPAQHNAFLYIFQGEAHTINDMGKANSVIAPGLVILTQGDRLVLETSNEAGLMLAAAQKIDEPIIRWGPFVMNTREEIEQTLWEIREGQFPPE